MYAGMMCWLGKELLMCTSCRAVVQATQLSCDHNDHTHREWQPPVSAMSYMPAAFMLYTLATHFYTCALTMIVWLPCLVHALQLQAQHSGALCTRLACYVVHQRFNHGSFNPCIALILYWWHGICCQYMCSLTSGTCWCGYVTAIKIRAFIHPITHPSPARP